MDRPKHSESVIAVRAVIHSSDDPNRILLATSPGLRYSFLPGGKFRPGLDNEPDPDFNPKLSPSTIDLSLSDGLAREIAEETGSLLMGYHFLGLVETHWQSDSPYHVNHQLNVVFDADVHPRLSHLETTLSPEAKLTLFWAVASFHNLTQANLKPEDMRGALPLWLAEVSGHSRYVRSVGSNS